jgi:hypothetical protein
MASELIERLRATGTLDANDADAMLRYLKRSPP